MSEPLFRVERPLVSSLWQQMVDEGLPKQLCGFICWERRKLLSISLNEAFFPLLVSAMRWMRLAMPSETLEKTEISPCPLNVSILLRFVILDAWAGIVPSNFKQFSVFFGYRCQALYQGCQRCLNHGVNPFPLLARTTWATVGRCSKVPMKESRCSSERLAATWLMTSNCSWDCSSSGSSLRLIASLSTDCGWISIVITESRQIYRGIISKRRQDIQAVLGLQCTNLIATAIRVRALITARRSRGWFP